MGCPSSQCSQFPPGPPGFSLDVPDFPPALPNCFSWCPPPSKSPQLLPPGAPGPPQFPPRSPPDPAPRCSPPRPRPRTASPGPIAPRAPQCRRRGRRLPRHRHRRGGGVPGPCRVTTAACRVATACRSPTTGTSGRSGRSASRRAAGASLTARAGWGSGCSCWSPSAPSTRSR